MARTQALAAALVAAFLSGCETTSETLDAAEAKIRETRVAYQERMDRIAADWICTGMSWPTLLRVTDGDQAVIEAIMAACRDRASVPPLVADDTDSDSGPGPE